MSSPRRPRWISRPALASLAALTMAAPAWAAWPSNGRAMCTAAGDQSYPALLCDGAGGAIVTWEDHRGATPDIYAQRVTAGGSMAGGWPGNGRALCTAAQDQLAPVIAGDGSAGAFVAWEDYRAGGAKPDIYVQHVTAAGAIAAGWPTDGVGVCTQSDVQGHPTIVSDGNGGAIVAWEDFRSGAGDIYAQRLSSAGLRQWAANGVALTSAAGHQRFPVAVSDGVGGAIVAWEDARVGDSDVYAQRVDAAGHPMWLGDGVPVCVATLDQVGLRIAEDDASGAIISWEDHRDDNSDIYAQRVDAGGARKWIDGGIGLCRDLSEQYSAAIAHDGSGGAFVAWTDLRGDLEDVYAQHVTGAGAIANGWNADGRAVCAASGSQFDPRVASDNAGGAFISWIDNRPGTASLDIYAQRIAPDGAKAPGWPTDGLALCSSVADQPVAAIVPDGFGGAVVAWHDLRSGDADIYSLRVTASGGAATVDVAEAEESPVGLLPAFPNPFHSQTCLRFRLACPEQITAMIVDVTGRRVRSLIGGESLPSGDHAILWDGRDASGTPVPGGVYLFLLSAGTETTTSKLAVVR